MNDESRINAIELILTSAIDDYSKRTGKTISEIRNELIQSGTYDAIYDEETGLWTQGPDYFIDYFEKMKQTVKKPINGIT